MRRLVTSLALIAAASIPIATADAGSSRPNLAKPPTGKYKLDDRGTGSFKVKKKVISGLSIKPSGEFTPDACKVGSIKVKAKLKLSTTTRGGFSAWIVGRHKPSDPEGYVAKNVTFLVDGAKMPGTLRMIFDFDNVKAGNGTLTFGACTLNDFHFKK